ncbi:MAG: MBL fold metallo-hydrolase [Roseiflexaceae bacterium]|nr:MBL fold metallo-hydrolase [Roseiflexaceae bacterium]
MRAGVDPTDLAAILITHHHYDHIGNLGDLLLTAWHGGAAHLPFVGPPGTDAIVQALLGQVYRREIHFAQALARTTGLVEREIADVVQVVPIVGAQSLQCGPWAVTAAAVDHGIGLGLTWKEWPCLAYRLQAGGRTVVVSGDTAIPSPATTSSPSHAAPTFSFNVASWPMPT